MDTAGYLVEVSRVTAKVPVNRVRGNFPMMGSRRKSLAAERAAATCAGVRHGRAVTLRPVSLVEVLV